MIKKAEYDNSYMNIEELIYVKIRILSVIHAIDYSQYRIKLK